MIWWSPSYATSPAIWWSFVTSSVKLATCTLTSLTIGCMRPGEGARSTTCNLKFDSDFLKGLLSFKDCSSLVTNNSKQDQERKGHWMRFGKSSDPDGPDLVINHQLGLFMDLAGIRPSPECVAARLRGKWCLTCAPLFPKLAKGSGDSWVLHPDPVPSPACVSAWWLPPGQSTVSTVGQSRT